MRLCPRNEMSIHFDAPPRSPSSGLTAEILLPPFFGACCDFSLRLSFLSGSIGRSLLHRHQVVISGNYVCSDTLSPVSVPFFFFGFRAGVSPFFSPYFEACFLSPPLPPHPPLSRRTRVPGTPYLVNIYSGVPGPILFNDPGG